MPTGIVRSFNPKSGYGFIRPDDGSKDIFVHGSAVKHAGFEALSANQKLSFEVLSELDGRRSAIELKVLS